MLTERICLRYSELALSCVHRLRRLRALCVRRVPGVSVCARRGRRRSSSSFRSCVLVLHSPARGRASTLRLRVSAKVGYWRALSSVVCDPCDGVSFIASVTGSGRFFPSSHIYFAWALTHKTDENERHTQPLIPLVRKRAIHRGSHSSSVRATMLRREPCRLDSSLVLVSSSALIFIQTD